MNNHDSITFRFRWLTPILSIITLLGIAYGLYKKPYKWDEAADKVEVISQKVAQHDEQLAVINNKLDDISDDLKEILRRSPR